MIEIRTTKPDEYRAAAGAMATALLFAPPDDEAWEKYAPSWEDTDSLSAWEHDRCVGHAGAYRVETIVPGGARLATAAVSRVGVLPTHRRRGLARDVIHRLLREAAADGRALASLRASEAVIYHRFGFGIAGRASEVTVDPLLAGPVRAAASGGTMRILAPDEILDVVRPIYDRVATRPGTITRTDGMWRRYLEDATKAGGSAHFVAVHSGPDGDDGFVHYSVKWREQPYSLVGAGDGDVFDLYGATPAVELALWAYLCDLDLIRQWHAEERPVDDLVRLAVRDPRAYHVRVGGWDEQWLRLLDVDAALRARTYGEARGVVTIAVEDDLFDTNTGLWSIDADGAKRLDGATAEAADLATDITTLSAAYLGGTPWTALADVGYVTVRSPEALARADALFATPVAPFCGSFF